nr:MAG TPA: hypothetical protein [Crassvirales sp.]
MRQTITSPLLFYHSHILFHYYNQNSTVNHLLHLYRSLFHNELNH